jgi:hypothetical protein
VGKLGVLLVSWSWPGAGWGMAGQCVHLAVVLVVLMVVLVVVLPKMALLLVPLPALRCKVCPS